MHKTVAHYLLTRAQQVPEKWLHPGQLSTVLEAVLHDVVCYGLSTWPLQPSCPGSAASQFLLPPSSLTDRTVQEVETPLALYSTAQQQLKHQCVINVFLPKPKCSIKCKGEGKNRTHGQKSQ